MNYKERLIQKIQQRFPSANFEILSYGESNSSPITIKCLDCGQIKTYTRIYGILDKSKTRFCSNCGETVSQRQAKEKIESKGYKFINYLYSKDNAGKTIFQIEFQCPYCGLNTIRRIWNVLHICDECEYCGRGHRAKKPNFLFEKELLEKRPDFFSEYSLLEEYKTAREKIKVRHLACNFIFQVSPDNLLHKEAGCPRCNRYNSKGSRAIKSWLVEQKIDFETEKKFEWSENKRYDFYLPKQNLLIEFNGKQHYEPIPFFCQSRTFEESQAADQFKEQAAIEHGYNFLIIRYDEVDKIPQILSSSTTIRKEQTQAGRNDEAPKGV